jgi:hypothetical protein
MDSGGGGGGAKAASGSAPSAAAAAPNPTAMLSALMSKRAKLQEEVRSIERQVRSPPAPVSSWRPALFLLRTRISLCFFGIDLGDFQLL